MNLLSFIVLLLNIKQIKTILRIAYDNKNLNNKIKLLLSFLSFFLSFFLSLSVFMHN